VTRLAAAAALSISSFNVRRTHSVYWRQRHPRCGQQLVTVGGWLLSITRECGHLWLWVAECGTSTGALTVGPGLSMIDVVGLLVGTWPCREFYESAMVRGDWRQLLRLTIWVPGKVGRVRCIAAGCWASTVVTAHRAWVIPHLLLARQVVPPSIASDLKSHKQFTISKNVKDFQYSLPSVRTRAYPGTIRYDTVDLRALKSWWDGQLNLAHQCTGSQPTGSSTRR